MKSARKKPLRRADLAAAGLPALDSLQISRVLERLFGFVTHVALFLFLIYPYGDYDWGWHYRYGEYFLEHGELLRKDIFSWTMEGYEWINHSWLYDPLLYVVYHNFSFVGLSIAGATIAILAFTIGTCFFDLSYWQKAFLAFFYFFLMPEVMHQGLRTQVAALPLFASLTAFLILARKGKKWPCFALPFLFLLWANLHGSFLLGLVIFGFFWISLLFLELLQAGSLRVAPGVVSLLISFAASIAATLVNPFGYHIYLESMRHFNSPLLSLVREWNPAPVELFYVKILALYTLFLLVGFIRRKSIADLPYIGISLLLFYLALTALRHIGFYMIATLPFAAMILSHFALRLERFKATAVVFCLAAATALCGGYLRLAPIDLFLKYSFEDYCILGPRCSETLVGYLRENPPAGRGFNEYDWGGFLIGRGIQAKVFVDGRMHLWQRNGYSPFLDQTRIFDELDLQRFAQYQFDWVMVRTGSDLAKILEASRTNLAIGSWDKVYSDRRGSYFVRRR
ncbi:MAG: hypothetical protein HY695_23925 [Deltaproteobacteria bacterium]|nr:hypothetical protein [Deltaproteobacteria bacterium]